MANRNFPNKGNLYAMHCKPVIVDCTFTVQLAATTGLGISSLKGSGMIKNIFMKSSATAAALAAGNPLPNTSAADGVIVVQLKDNYQRLLGVSYGIQSPASGSDVKIDNSAMTVGTPYIITTLGNATTAKWVAIGVPVGITPAVGVAFIAATNGGAGNTLTSRVQTALAIGSAVETIEVTGDPNTTNAANASVAPLPGGQIILQARAATNSSTTTLAAKIPSDLSVIRLQLYYDDSSVLPGDGG